MDDRDLGAAWEVRIALDEPRGPVVLRLLADVERVERRAAQV